MYMKIITKYRTPFYGYCNGDILFDHTLSQTLQSLLSYTKHMHQSLIIGQRTNVNMTKTNISVETLSNITKLKNHGKLFITMAQDYFITTATGFPRKRIPDFTIGRPGYDNWLVATTNINNYVIIHTTRSILALHQTDKDGNYAGHKNSFKMFLKIVD